MAFHPSEDPEASIFRGFCIAVSLSNLQNSKPKRSSNNGHAKGVMGQDLACFVDHLNTLNSQTKRGVFANLTWSVCQRHWDYLPEIHAFLHQNAKCCKDFSCHFNAFLWHKDAFLHTNKMSSAGRNLRRTMFLKPISLGEGVVVRFTSEQR